MQRPVMATPGSNDAVEIASGSAHLDGVHIAAGYRIGDTVIVSGQAAVDEQGRTVAPGDFDAQAEQAFSNLRRVLEAAGSSLAQVVKVNIYLTDMRNFPKIVDLRARYFTPPWPADTIVGVSALAYPELEIEIEATALVNGRLVGADRAEQ